MFHDLVVRCRSVRTFDESRPVTEDEVRALIDTSRLCASAANLQPLKYRIVTGDECASVQKLTKWAGALPDLKLPPEGKMPTAFVLICHDTAISKITDCASMDVGIAAQTLVLAAAEVGIGSCMRPNDRGRARNSRGSHAAPTHCARQACRKRGAVRTEERIGQVFPRRRGTALCAEAPA